MKNYVNAGVARSRTAPYARGRVEVLLMNLSYTHRLVHLQHELDTVASSTSGLSLLHSLRRELTRLLRQLPPPVLYSLPSTLQASVQRSLAELTAPARFPAPGQPLLTAQAQQALAVLERLARDYDLTLPPFPTTPCDP